MHAELDRVDSVLDASDGGLVLVQREELDLAQLSRRPELSIVFGLVRVLNAQRLGERAGCAQPRVVYALEHGPAPEFLLAALAAARVELTVQGRPVASFGPRLKLGQVANAAMGRLALRVSEQTGHPLTVAGLRQLERGGPVGEAPSAHDRWKWTLELGAFAGEVIRRHLGGGWVRSATGVLPLAYRVTRGGTDRVLDLFGPSRKAVVGPKRAVSALVASELGRIASAHVEAEHRAH